MKRIKKARIKWLTLCPRGKNYMPVLYKEDGTVEFETIVKASEDLGEITAIVYPVEKEDADGHVASAAVIKDMAHEFQKSGGQIDIRHNGIPVPKDKAYVAESFIVQKGDPRYVDSKDYDGNSVDATGAWATVVRIDDPELRQLYKEGEWNGVSMAGDGLLTVEKADEDAPGWLNKLLKAVGLGTTPTPDTPEVDMDEKTLEAVLEKQFTKLTETLASKAEKKVEIKKEDEVTLDITDAKAVQALATTLAKEEARKNFDPTDAKAVQELANKLSKEAADAIVKAEANDTDEVKDLKAQLRKAEIKGGTNQADNADEGDLQYAGLTKEQASEAELGDAMADFLNGTKKEQN